jgi:exopolyphosphatase/guanosine-5'-triphosphate,3'-diphosphate pyrophosphatase
VPDEPVSAALEEKSAEARRLARTKNPENLPGRKKNAKTRERQRSAAPEQSKPYAYAALDLGTNNCRLLIAIPGMEGEFRVVGSFSRIVRLGDGLEHTGRLREDAMDRAVEALAVCAERLDDRRIKRVRLIATEACRRASNGEAFLQRVEEETGIKLEIVNRETEARLAVSGCGSLVDPKAKGAVLFDIGGGSSEVALLDFRQKRHRKLSENIVEWTSLPVGVVTLADRFGGKDVTRESYAEMVAAVEEMIAEFAGQNALKNLHDGPDFHLLGTSGTVTTLAGIHLKLERYDRRRVDGVWMSDHQLDAMIDELLGMDFVQRQQNPCIGVDRADLVLAGCAILDAIRNTWPAKRLRVADRGLREGLLMEMMHEDVAWRKKPHKQGQRYHGRGGGSRNEAQRHRSASRQAESGKSGKKPGQQR